MKKERERMSEFYNSLAEKMQSGSCVVMTVLEGESAGRKLLVTEPVEQYEGHAVFCERAGSLPRLVICGGGHVSIPMIRMGKMLGFQVTVLEDRPKFADNARVAGADVEPGEILSIRGVGKFLFSRNGGQTKKGRISVTFLKYR